MQAPLIDGKRTILFLLALVALLALRLALIPGSAEYTRAFSHDSAYLAAAAANVLSGKGLVNDALWLVFMMPASLPMPYHNANPLFSMLTVGIAYFTGADVFEAGFVVSALSSVILFAALVALLRHYLPQFRYAPLIALAVVLFPPGAGRFVPLSLRRAVRRPRGRVLRRGDARLVQRGVDLRRRRDRAGLADARRGHRHCAGGRGRTW